MRISGAWRVHDDQIARPTFWGEMLDASGRWIEVLFAADCGADRTVFTRDVFEKLGVAPSDGRQALIGLGGLDESFVFQSVPRMRRSDGALVHFRGEFAASTHDGLDMCLLGRDISNHFALIIDRPGDTVGLLSRGEIYQA